MLRLPLEVAPLFRAWLDEHYPLRAAHVMSLVQQLRGGRDYVSTFGDAHARHRRLRRPHREALRARLRAGSGLNQHRTAPFDTSKFRPPRINEAQGELSYRNGERLCHRQVWDQ